MSKPKYYTNPVKVILETEDGYTTLFVRAKVPKALIPGAGQVKLPEFLVEQGELSVKLAKEQKAKTPKAALIATLQREFKIGDILSQYDDGADSSIFAVRSSADDFEVEGVEEAITLYEEKVLELEEKESELAELKEQLALVTKEKNEAVSQISSLQSDVESLNAQLASIPGATGEAKDSTKK